MLFRLLQLLLLTTVCLAVIDNRKPLYNYVIPINDSEIALVHCVSYFGKTIFQKVVGPKPADMEPMECDKCTVKEVRHTCCKKVYWADVELYPITLRCTSESSEWGKDKPNVKNVPRIQISVVRRTNNTTGQTLSNNRTKADSKTLYYCHNVSNDSHTTAGSHIGLGWVSLPLASDTSNDTMYSTPETSYTDKGQSYAQIIYNKNDNARNRDGQFSSHYSNPKFAKLWISEDKKVELMAHNTDFTCNETNYTLPVGSRCMTPSARAIFITVNCSLVEQIFIVIGVILLLVLAYIVFNVLVWLWDYTWHKSRTHDDDLLSHDDVLSHVARTTFTSFHDSLARFARAWRGLDRTT